MSLYRKFESGLFTLFFACILLQLKGISLVLPAFLTLGGLTILWIYAFIKSKSTNTEGFYRKNLVEKILVSFLLWAITFNVFSIPFSALFIKFFLLPLCFYYLINGIVRWIRKKREWFNAIERILLSFILIGSLFRIMSWPGGPLITGVMLLLLSSSLLVYSIVSLVKLIQQKQALLGILSMFIYSSLSLCASGLLFDFMSWPGASVMLIAAIVFVLALAIPFFILYARKSNALEEKTHFELYHTSRRMAVYCILCLFFLFLTKKQYMKFIYGNRSELIESHYNCLMNGETGDGSYYCTEAERLYELYREGKYPEDRE